jgi:hypothetical protein
LTSYLFESIIGGIKDTSLIRGEIMWTTYKELYEVRLLTSEDRPIIMEIFQNDEAAVDRVFTGWNHYNRNVLVRRKSDERIVAWRESNTVENADGSKVWYVGARAMHPDFRDGGVTLRAVAEEAIYYVFHTWGAKVIYVPVLRAKNDKGVRYNWEAAVPSVSTYTEQNDNYGFVEITKEQYLGSV